VLDVRGLIKSKAMKCKCIKVIRVGDPDADPQDPHFLGILDPDPLVIGIDPDPAPAPCSHKVVE
jgi:hypothetical protein